MVQMVGDLDTIRAEIMEECPRHLREVGKHICVGGYVVFPPPLRDGPDTFFQPRIKSGDKAVLIEDR